MQITQDVFFRSKPATEPKAKSTTKQEPATQAESSMLLDALFDEPVSVEVSEEALAAVTEQPGDGEAQESSLQKSIRELEERQAEALKQMQQAAQAGGANAMKFGSSKPTDSSGALNKRLVAALSQMEVQQVISSASKDLISLRVAAAMCSDKDDAQAIKAIVRKLEKIVTRGQRKIRDLTQEEGMQQKEIQARQRKEEQRADEIKKELREYIRERKRREKKYLRETEEKQNASNPAQASPPGTQNQELDAATEAQIAALAEAQAAVEVSPGSGGDTGGGDFGGSGGTPASPSSEGATGGSADAAGGGEAAASAEGGGE